jgi:transposase-like protein
MENTIVLTNAERMELNQRAASRSGRADDARRARLLLLLEAGHTWAAIRDKLDCNDAFIDRWRKRFREERLAGLFSRHAGQEASTSDNQILVAVCLSDPVRMIRDVTKPEWFPFLGRATN